MFLAGGTQQTIKLVRSLLEFASVKVCPGREELKFFGEGLNRISS